MRTTYPPPQKVLGIKVVTRNENRRKRGLPNIEGDILLYSYDDFMPIALIDGALITTIRTAAVAVHSVLNFAPKKDVIAFVGLGNIGTEIGNIMFPLLKGNHTVKLFKYKDHAEKFIEKFKKFTNISFVVYDTYDELMAESDVVISAVTYIENDFCLPSVFKKGCTVVPVHLRGFKACDKEFDHVITSDLISIKKFQNYDSIKKLSYLDDMIQNGIPENQEEGERRIIYNLGLAVYDLYFAAKIYEKLIENNEK